MKKLSAFILALVLFAIPLVAEASSNYVQMSVILGAGAYEYGNHWKFTTNTFSFVPESDTLSFIVAAESAVLDPTGVFPFIEYGSYTDYAGARQFYYTRAYSTATCLTGYVPGFPSGGINYGCVGNVPNEWGVGQDEDQEFQMNFYPTNNNIWQSWVKDLQGAFHGIAMQSGASNAFYYPQIAAAETYYAASNPNYQMVSVFRHPFAWTSSAWVDIPTATLASTNTNHADDGFCPYVYGVVQMTDKRTWFAGTATDIALTDKQCTNGNFWP